MTSWTQVTQTEEKPDGIDFTFTPQERDAVQMARLDVIALQFSRDTSGLEVSYVPASDLTNEERAAFGMGGL